MKTAPSPTWPVRRSNTGTPCGLSGSAVCSRPRWSTSGRRPVAAGRSSKRSSCTVPSASSVRSSTASPSRRGCRSRTFEVSGNSAANTSWARACSAGCVSGPMRLPRPSSRTRTPSRCSACASSGPTTPVPTTATEAGRSAQLKTSSLTIRRSPSSARQAGGTAGREPVAMTMRPACTRSVPPGPSTTGVFVSTKRSRSLRTRAITARPSIAMCGTFTPKRPAWRAVCAASAAAISSLPGMQPTRAQVVP